MKNKNIFTVFSFTRRMTMRSSGWRNTTIALALLLVIVPLIIFAIVGAVSSSENVYSGSITEVYTVDTTEDPVDFSFLSSGDKEFREIKYLSVASLDEAKASLEKNNSAVMLLVTESDGEYRVQLVTNDTTSISKGDLGFFETFIANNFSSVLFLKSGLSPNELAVLMSPVNTATFTQSESDGLPDDAEDEDLREIFSMLVPYITVMFMYFFVLFYGQSTAQTVLVEKTSKLMDTVLVSVKPAHMILGKVFACIFCAIFQIFVWLISLLLGLLGGIYVLKLIVPSTGITLKYVLDILSSLDGVFEPTAVILSILIVISGCVLYCSLASVGGALAGKQEDLQSTNLLFTMALIISFFTVIFGGGGYMSSGMMNTAPWLDFIPFTAVLITPAKVLIGETSIILGIVSLLITVVFSVLIMIASGKIYKMMSFYKGNVKKVGEIAKILRLKA